MCDCIQLACGSMRMRRRDSPALLHVQDNFRLGQVLGEGLECFVAAAKLRTRFARQDCKSLVQQHKPCKWCHLVICQAAPRCAFGVNYGSWSAHACMCSQQRRGDSGDLPQALKP